MPHIAVVKGGWSAEREVSLMSGAAAEKALHALGHKVSAIDAGHDIAEQLAKLRPDVVFNALHGRFGEDGCLQGVLEILEIPYTHSGLLASALAMHKPKAKELFTAAGIPCAEGRIFKCEELFAAEPMPRPYVVKPLNEGSSVGVTIVTEDSNIVFSPDNWDYSEEVLVERYIPGREIQVAVLDDEALGAIEIRPKGRFYDYEAKYSAGKAEHLMPAPLPENKYREILELGLRAHRSLGCRGLTRTDFRYYDVASGGNDQFYILETNTQPGMTPLSLCPEIAAHVGITFETLISRLIAGARLGG